MQKVFWIMFSLAVSYLSYRVIKDALERPPTETRGPDPDDPVACSYWDMYGEP